jgi:hypothetical protein
MAPRSKKPISDASPAALTPIHRRIHCAATPEDVEAAHEMDELVVDSFLETLSEVALAIARREGRVGE